jgi:hypothetical protein
MSSRNRFNIQGDIVAAGTVIATENAAPFDLFARVRVATTQTLLDAKRIFSANNFLYRTVTSGVGNTATYANSCLSLTVAADGYAISQTKEYAPYQAGKTRLSKITFSTNDAALPAGVTARIGMFDEKYAPGTVTPAIGVGCGVYLQITSAGLALVDFDTDLGITTSVAQASWNIDPLDGSGPSGATLNTQKNTLMFFDLLWLGAGVVQAGFVINGQVLYAHQFTHSSFSKPYWRTPCLPMRWQIQASSPAASATLNAICCSVESEAGYAPVGFPFSSALASTVSATTTGTVFTALRLKTPLLRCKVSLQSVEVMTTNSNNALVIVYSTPNNATNDALVWNDASANSQVQVWNGTSGFDNAGAVALQSFYVSNQSRLNQTDSVNSYYDIPVTFDAKSDYLAIFVRGLTATATVVIATAWTELQ